MNPLKSLVPRAFVDHVRLREARRRHPFADYIRTPHVAPGASIGRRCGIGEDVVINDGVSLGDFTYVNRGAIIFSGAIGRFCSIAHFAQIGAERHPVRHLSTSPLMYSDKSVTGSSSGFVELPEPPTIGSDVWVGSAAIIMQGVIVGDGAIVGAGAVVTKDVAPYSIVAGVPAKVIGSRFDERVVQQLLEWRWWSLPDAELASLAPFVKAGERWVDAGIKV
jgi:virginiamycin A acetyltransferase